MVSAIGAFTFEVLPGGFDEHPALRGAEHEAPAIRRSAESARPSELSGRTQRGQPREDLLAEPGHERQRVRSA